MDEAAMNNSVILKAVSDYAIKDNAIVVALGDPFQNSGKLSYLGKNITTGKDTTVTVSDGYEDCFGIKSPYLIANFRSSCRAKVDNYSKLLYLISTTNDEVIEKYDAATQTNVDDVYDTIKKDSTIRLVYAERGDKLYGDRIVSEETKFQELLDKAIASGEEVLIVVDGTTASKYSSDKYSKNSKVRIASAKEAQGGEYTYVFMDKEVSIKTDGKYNTVRDLYTLSQRGTRASVVLDPTDQYKSLNIISDYDSSASMPWEMTGSQKKDYGD